ncbi:MAG: hypothetical protein U5K37_02435 [Natrialbaceae archaeon]|nr:hypothetical protein [Natrialbaceae archaeon]
MRQLRPPPGWGLEIASLGDAYRHVGRAGTAQIDLGCHEHDHRDVAGEDGLEGMSAEVAAAVTRLVEDHGLTIEYDRLRRRFRTTGRRLIEQYAADARFNGLEYSIEAEREQLESYADAIQPNSGDSRLPSWASVDLEPAEIVRRAAPTATRSQY